MLGDFLITMLKRILPLRPDIRVVLMSATLNSRKFSQFFGKPYVPSNHGGFYLQHKLCFALSLFRWLSSIGDSWSYVPGGDSLSWRRSSSHWVRMHDISPLLSLFFKSYLNLTSYFSASKCLRMRCIGSIKSTNEWLKCVLTPLEILLSPKTFGIISNIGLKHPLPGILLFPNPIRKIVLGRLLEPYFCYMFLNIEDTN